ncbi:nucleotidyltransferase domain-containing protein [Candidatus Woesearchaeota archaeon]|nr:nucleotidyltransferase domain-containing protein [Candidatus Woesearchaeota archaeon]
MNNQTKILVFFLEHQEEMLSIRAASRKLNMNYKIAYEEIKKLEKEQILSLKKIGNAYLCNYAYAFNEKTLAAELERKKLLLSNTNFKILAYRFQEVKDPFFITLIFGSYSRGKATKNSDIDLCIITSNQNIEKRVGQIIRTLALPIKAVFFSPEEFLSMLKTTDNNVGKEILKNHVLLQGIEAFYKVVMYAYGRTG